MDPFGETSRRRGLGARAHRQPGVGGSHPQVVAATAARGLRIVDATGPIVRKSQKVIQRLQEAGFQVIVQLVGE